MSRYCSFCVMLLSLALIGSPRPEAAEIPTETKSELSEFVSLFDGKSLDGWVGDKPFWSVRDGAILGQITEQTKIRQNRFLVCQKAIPADFELIAEYRVSREGNSGINYRSELVPKVDFHALRGYQCDIDGRNQYTGSNYEERRRTTLASLGQSVVIPAVTGSDQLKHIQGNRWSAGIRQPDIAPANQLRQKIKQGQWNEVRIVARGNQLQHYINGQLMSQVIDNDSRNRRTQGHLGVQVHVGPPMTIEYRKLRIRSLLPAQKTTTNKHQPTTAGGIP